MAKHPCAICGAQASVREMTCYHIIEPRSDAELNRWLDNTQRLLKLAIEDRKHVEELDKKYGPNARWIGD
jgi:hypothetical protein